MLKWGNSMKKIMLIIILTLFFTSGCVFDEKTATLAMDCNGEASTIEAKKGVEFQCELLTEVYKFKVTNVTNTYVVIKTNQDGISSGAGIWDSEYKWKVEKDDALIIHTNSTDYQEKLILNWK